MVQRLGCGVAHTPPWPVASSGTGTKSPAPLYLDDAAFSAIGRHMWNRHHIPESVSSQAAADTDSCCLQQRVRHPVHVMTIMRSTSGINNADGRHDERANRVHRCVAAGLADEADQLSLISWLDPPGGLVRSEFSNICFEAMRRQE